MQLTREELNRQIDEFFAKGGQIDHAQPKEQRPKSRKPKLTPTAEAVGYQEWCREFGIEIAN